MFLRMGSIYGSKFADMWRDQDIDVVKAMWADEMGKLRNDQLKTGYGLLMTKTWPPSLPEYVQMCKSESGKDPSHVFALPAPKSELSREKAAAMLVELGAAEVMKPKADHKLWAKKIIERSRQRDHGLSSLQIRFAKEGLAA